MAVHASNLSIPVHSECEPSLVPELQAGQGYTVRDPVSKTNTHACPTWRAGSQCSPSTGADAEARVRSSWLSFGYAVCFGDQRGLHEAVRRGGEEAAA